MSDATVFLIALAAKASVVLAVAAVAVRLLSRAPAATRHWVWLAAIVAVLALPLAMIAGPTFSVRVADAPRHPVVQAFFAPTPAYVPLATPGIETPGIETPGIATADVAPQLRVRDETVVTVPSPVTVSAARNDAGGAWAVAFWLWALGAALFGIRIALDLFRARWLKRGARALATSEVSSLMRNVLVARSRTRVRLWASERVATPMTFGVFARHILLPVDYERWSDADRRAVLAHETAHAIRGDCGAQLLARLMCAVHWFNPLAWIAARALRAEAERACDDRVLSAGAPALDYADLLVRFARQPVPRAHARLALPMASAGRELERRLEAIVDPVVPRGAPSFHARLVSAIVAAATLSVAAGARLEATPSAMTVPGVEQTDARPDAPQDAPQAKPNERDFAPVRSPGDGAPPQVATRPIAARGDTLADPRSERIPLSDATMTAARAAVATLSGPDSVLAHSMFMALDRAPKHDGDLVRERAAWALARARGARLVEPLIEALGSSDWREAAYAAWAFSHAPDVRALTPLIALLDHGAWRARAIAATALRALADDRAAHAMRGALNDEAWQVRAEVVEYFGALSDAVSLDAIRVLADDPHIAVRDAVRAALSGGRKF